MLVTLTLLICAVGSSCIAMQTIVCMWVLDKLIVESQADTCSSRSTLKKISICSPAF